MTKFYLFLAAVIFATCVALSSCATTVHCRLTESNPNQNRKASNAVSVWHQVGNSRLPKYQAKFGPANLVLACFERGSHIWVDYIATNVGSDTLVYDAVNRTIAIPPGHIALLASTDLGAAPRSRNSVRVAKVQVKVPYLRSSKELIHRIEDLEFSIYR
jgi:hypothetical protein